jgi:hypothetical protein
MLTAIVTLGRTRPKLLVNFFFETREEGNVASSMDYLEEYSYKESKHHSDEMKVSTRHFHTSL